MRLGTVDAGGIVRYSGTLPECMNWLILNGFEVDPDRGWCKPGWLGILQFWRGEHRASFWRTGAAS